MTQAELTGLVTRAVFAKSPGIAEARAAFEAEISGLSEAIGASWDASDGKRIAALTVRAAYSRANVAAAETEAAFDAAVEELSAASEKGWDVFGSMMANQYAAALPIGMILTMVITIISGFITNPTVKAFLLSLIEILRNLPI